MSFEKEIIEAEFRTVSSSKTLQEIEKLSNGILRLQRETEQLERKKKEAVVQFGNNSKEVKELTVQIKANNAQISLQKSKLEEVNKKLKVTEMSSAQLRKRQAELKKAMGTVNKEAFPDRWNKLNKAYLETSVQLNKINRGSGAVKKGVGSIMSYAKGLLPAFGFTAITGGLISLSKDLFQLSMQMKSDNIRNATIFGDELGYVEKEAARLRKTMGLTNREFVANAASSADLLKPLGFTSKEAAELSVKMQELAGPLAEWSKGKYDAVQITEVLNGAMTGEMERLKGLGIIIRQDSDEYKNLVKSKQQEKNVSLDQAKALATLELMYNKSKDAQIAYAAGGNKLFRMWEGLKASVRGWKEAFVQAFDETVEERLTKQSRLVNSLTVKLTDANSSEAERVEILKQLEIINPRIVEGLNAENISVQTLKTNLEKYNDEIAKTIALENLNQKERIQQAKLADKKVREAEARISLGDAMMELDPDVALNKEMSLEGKYEKILGRYSESQIKYATTPSRYNVADPDGGPSIDQRSKEEKNLERMISYYRFLENSTRERLELEKETMALTTKIEKVKDELSGGKKVKEPTNANHNFTNEQINTQNASLSKSATVEQENKRYEKELVDAGLNNRKKEELTGQALVSLEAINKTHQDNLAKLDKEAITKYLEEKKVGYQRALTDLRISQNNELSTVKTVEEAKVILSKTMSAEELDRIKTMEQARKALDEKSGKEERELTRKQAEEMVKMVSDIQAGKEINGLKLADKIMSQEESKLLQERLQQARDLLAKIVAGDAKSSMELTIAQQKVREEVLQASMTLVEQENLAYKERLINTGLFGKKKEELTGEDLQVLETLEKTHQKKLNELDKNAIVTYINKKNSVYQKELSELKVKQDQEYASLKSFGEIKEVLAKTLSSQELAGINTLSEARKALQEQNAKESRDLVARQTVELLGLLQSLTDGKSIPDLKLADKLFSPEEKEEIEKQIAKLKESLAIINRENVDAEGTTKPQSGVDILGMSPEQWQALFKNLEQGKIGIQDIQAVTGAMMNAWGMASDFMTATENRRMKEYEKSTKKQKTALAKQLDSGEISQEQYNARVAKLDSDLDEKKEEIAKKQANREKAMAITNAIINTALSISKTAATLGFPAAVPFIAIAAAMGAVQVATIAAQPAYKKGGFTRQSTDDDSEAGIVHTNEFVANAKAVRNPTVLPVLQMIDKAQRDGTISTLDLSHIIRGGYVSGGFTSPVDGINHGNDRNMEYVYDPEVKQLLRENIKMMRELACKKLEVSWYGKGGIKEKMERSAKYEQKISGK
nr:hypothetical protein [uncultured Butyricimonas sp.]